MNNQPPTQQPQQRVFDVTPPGRTLANPTSRPVLPSRKVVQDPDVIVGAKKSATPVSDIQRQIESDLSGFSAKTVGTVGSDPPVAVADGPEGRSPAANSQPAVTPSSVAPQPPPATPAANNPDLSAAVPTFDAPAQAQPSATPAAPHHTKTEVAEGVGHALMDTSGIAEPAPIQTQGTPVVSKHKPGSKRTISIVLAITAIILLLAATLNLLADAEVLRLPIPHTSWF